MAGTNVGSVFFDVGMNDKGFKKGVQSNANYAESTFGKAFGKIGKMAVAAFSVAAITKFASKAIDLASDLEEVQNVIDVTFGAGNKKIEGFAQSAMTSFGLSELAAKQYMGTMGAMLKSMGLSQSTVEDMSTSLVGLAADMASFYNLDSDDAFNKLRAGISGETEPLKQLGINMSVANMEAFAMSQGITKAYNAMSQSEQALLRYNYLMSVTSDAQGDFARTSDGWANQVRVLKLQWESFMTSLGSVFITVLKPVVQGLNWLLSKLIVVANAFKSFVNMITGGKAEIASGGTDAAAESVEAVGDAAVAAGDKAAKGAKKAKGALASFDELNNLSTSDSSGGGESASGGGAGGMDMSGGVDFGTVDTSAIDSTVGSLDMFQQKLQEIADWTGFSNLWEGIKSGIDKINFEGIKTNFTSIFNSLAPIAQATFDGIGQVLGSSMGYLGSQIGGIVSLIGQSIEMTTGGIALFLESQGGTISTWISETATALSTGFDNLTFVSETIFGSLWQALEDNKLQIETSISGALTSLSTMGMTIGTIFTDMFTGLTEGLAEFTATHSADIDLFFSDIIGKVTDFSNQISTCIGDIFTSLSNWWEQDGKRVWDNIVDMFLDVAEWGLWIWNDILSPVIDTISEVVSDLWSNHLKPLWDKILSLITSIGDMVKALWDKFIKPVVDAVIKYLGPVIKEVLNTLVNVIGTIIGTIIDIVSGIIDAVKGIIDFITGVFTGDWKKAWEGIKTFFKGIWDGIWSIVKGIVNLIIDGINLLWKGIYKVVKGIVDAIGGVAGAIGDLFGQDWHFSMPANPPLIPKLAKGGIVDQPTLAMIGEAGKEAVVPLENNTGWMVNLANTLADALAAKLAMNQGNNNSQSASSVKLMLDGREMGEALLDYLSEAAERRNLTLVMRG